MTGSIACQADLSFSIFPKVHNLPMTEVGRVERIAKFSTRPYRPIIFLHVRALIQDLDRMDGLCLCTWMTNG